MKESIKQFLDWCENERQSHSRLVDLLSNGTMRTGSNNGSGWQDTTDRNLADSKRIVAEMDAMIAKIKADHA